MADAAQVCRSCPGQAAGYGRPMSVAEDGQFSAGEFAIEDMWVGVFSTKVLASGFGQVGDGRSFAFRIEGQKLAGRGVPATAQRSGPTAGRRCRHGETQCGRRRHHRRAQPGRCRPRRSCRRRSVHLTDRGLSAVVEVTRYGRRRACGAGDVVVAGCRVGRRAGCDRISAGVILGPPGDRVAGLLRRRRGCVVYRCDPIGYRGSGFGLLRPRHRADPQRGSGLCASARASQRRLLAGLVRHHRHDPDLRARACCSRTRSAPACATCG